LGYSTACYDENWIGVVTLKGHGKLWVVLEVLADTREVNLNSNASWLQQRFGPYSAQLQDLRAMYSSSLKNDLSLSLNFI
jgi:hypothetical protein